jgi:hypothetical protein
VDLYLTPERWWLHQATKTRMHAGVRM